MLLRERNIAEWDFLQAEHSHNKYFWTPGKWTTKN